MRAFLFCRYTIYKDDEELGATAQFTALSELQGTLAPHRQKADERKLDTLIMRPRRIKVGGKDVMTWSVGHILDVRIIAKYDKAKDRLEIEEVNDGSVRYSDFVAVPSLGVLAVDDRSGELHLGGKQALNRFRSVIRMLDGADASIEFEVSAAEARKALKTWTLTKFKFTIQPNNPRPVGRLAQELSDQMKLDGIGRVDGQARPAEGQRMHMSNSGYIAPRADLVEAGYGQMAITGVTEDGLQAEIKKPPFSPDLAKNEQTQAKPRELRVSVDDDGLSEEDVLKTAAKALIKFKSDE